MSTKQTARKWTARDRMMPVAGRQRFLLSLSLCIPGLLSREYQTDPEKWAKKSAFEFFNRIDRKYALRHILQSRHCQIRGFGEQLLSGARSNSPNRPEAGSGKNA
ncbi:MAG TPA: hypothetical protein VLA64_11995 [Azonexus sp.]|nr:hypothetical protein [Azonexus sp.]